MKLTTTTQLSLDGVMQSPGGPDEDDRGFTRGGWAHFDSESGEFVDQVFQRADAFLFGRKTYDVFAYSWGAAPKTTKSPIAAALHTKPKYVVSSTLHNPEWDNTKVLSADFAAAIANLKAQPGRTTTVIGAYADDTKALLEASGNLTSSAIGQGRPGGFNILNVPDAMYRRNPAAFFEKFAGQWLKLSALASVAPNPSVYPDFDDNLRDAFRR